MLADTWASSATCAAATVKRLNSNISNIHVHLKPKKVIIISRKKGEIVSCTKNHKKKNVPPTSPLSHNKSSIIMCINQNNILKFYGNEV